MQYTSESEEGCHCENSCYEARQHRVSSKLCAMQAPFSISLTAPASQAVLSNAQLASRMPVSEGLAQHTFEQTPPMSTYLVAFVIGDLTNVSALVPGRKSFDEPLTVSIWATPHRWAATHRNKLTS